MSNFYLTGNIPALEDAWIVGDAFLREVFAVFQASRTSANLRQEELPFLYRRFNLFYFFSNPLAGRNILLRILNSVIDGLNRHTFLPKYIIMLLDDNILRMMDLDSAGLTLQLERCMKWLAKQITGLIESRKEKMREMRPGALQESDEQPVLIWIEYFEKPYMRQHLLQENRNKFNRAINEMAIKEKNCRVMTIESLGIRHFDNLGKLSYTSKQQLWRDINYQTQRFYQGSHNLNPRYYLQNPINNMHRAPEEPKTDKDDEYDRCGTHQHWHHAHRSAKRSLFKDFNKH